LVSLIFDGFTAVLLLDLVPAADARAAVGYAAATLRAAMNSRRFMQSSRTGARG
jgi:hypothetical protein